MNIHKRSDAFVKLGEKISKFLKDEIKISGLDITIKKSFQQNGWFTGENVRYALSALSGMITEENILKWLSNYPSPNSPNKVTDSVIMQTELQTPNYVGVIMPSNIPLAGFHDFFCVLMSGNFFVGKCSSQDKILLRAIAEILIKIEPEFKQMIFFTENKFEKIDAVIATGSNNSSRYFEYYFGKYLHIIRKNRNSVAILSGNETEEEIKLLSNDIFLYFGLGCRNVSKIFVPENYDFEKLFSGIIHWEKIIHHNKYANNYTYYKTIYLMNKIKIWDNGFLLLKEDIGLSSPAAVLYYEFYKNEKQLNGRLKMDKENIQCVVASPLTPLLMDRGTFQVDFGEAQHPQLSDYADGIDTMKFLSGLKQLSV